MALVKTLIDNGNGLSRWHFAHDNTPGKMAVLTGPIFGAITLDDGTVYKVNADWIEIDEAHFGELDHKIGLTHERNGHPFEDDGVPFVHICPPTCGKFARPVKDHQQALLDGLTRQGRADLHGHPDVKLRLASIARDAKHIHTPPVYDEPVGD